MIFYSMVLPTML